MSKLPTPHHPYMSFNNSTIRHSGDYWSLTDMWKAAGSSKHQKPNDWLRQPEVMRFVAAVEKRYHEDIRKSGENTGSARIFPSAVESQKGRGGGTWAHWQVAIAYAKYLSPEFHMWANDAARRVMAVDPALVDELFDRMSVPDQQRTLTRLEGIATRRRYTDVLQTHGASGKWFGICTNNIYRPILGGGASEIRERRGLPKRVNVRDALHTSELAMVQLAEHGASDRIEARNVQGGQGCSNESARAARIVKEAYDRIMAED